jgi:hypothetical protein
MLSLDSNSRLRSRGNDKEKECSTSCAAWFL